ncbi:MULTISPECIES: hypothetical protein [unclassified Bartonella]|uniref:hypothetical protein n=1 Tax=unclassified Bartonella TaxID=2645622 RepID=UPI0035CE94E8
MTITQKMQSPWYFTELRSCNITLEKLKPIRGYFPESKTFGHSPMKKINAPLQLYQFAHQVISCQLLSQSRSHILSKAKSLIRFSSFHAVQYTTEILLQKYANAFPIGFYKVKSLSMSKNQYKIGKIIGILQKNEIITCY